MNGIESLLGQMKGTPESMTRAALQLLPTLSPQQLAPLAAAFNPEAYGSLEEAVRLDPSLAMQVLKLAAPREAPPPAVGTTPDAGQHAGAPAVMPRGEPAPLMPVGVTGLGPFMGAGTPQPKPPMGDRYMAPGPAAQTNYRGIPRSRGAVPFDEGMSFGAADIDRQAGERRMMTPVDAGTEEKIAMAVSLFSAAGGGAAGAAAVSSKLGPKGLELLRAGLSRLRPPASFDKMMPDYIGATQQVPGAPQGVGALARWLRRNTVNPARRIGKFDSEARPAGPDMTAFSGRP